MYKHTKSQQLKAQSEAVILEVSPPSRSYKAVGGAPCNGKS